MTQNEYNSAYNKLRIEFETKKELLLADEDSLENWFERQVDKLDKVFMEH